jgi:hypothetical protein
MLIAIGKTYGLKRKKKSPLGGVECLNAVLLVIQPHSGVGWYG